MKLIKARLNKQKDLRFLVPKLQLGNAYPQALLDEHLSKAPN